MGLGLWPSASWPAAEEAAEEAAFFRRCSGGGPAGCCRRVPATAALVARSRADFRVRDLLRWGSAGW
eukprot:6541081-Alexandrium_andersonii.AAC.1